jgi:hypothetical protein
LQVSLSLMVQFPISGTQRTRKGRRRANISFYVLYLLLAICTRFS